jgi:hypothetical protein
MVQPYFTRLPPARNEQVDVTATASTIAESRSEDQPRQVISIQNTSPTAGTDLITIRLGSSGIATANNGLVLDVGDIWTDATDSGYQCHQDTITAICATANGKLSILER